MTRRTRSILVDNTLGKVFTNTDSSATVDPLTDPTITNPGAAYQLATS